MVLNIQLSTQRAYDTEQLLSGLEAMVRTFRAEWARHNSLLVIDEADPDKVKPTVEAAITSIKNAADQLGEKIIADLDAMKAEAAVARGEEEPTATEAAAPSEESVTAA